MGKELKTGMGVHVSSCNPLAGVQACWWAQNLSAMPCQIPKHLLANRLPDLWFAPGQWALLQLS